MISGFGGLSGPPLACLTRGRTKLRTGQITGFRKIVDNRRGTGNLAVFQQMSGHRGPEIDEAPDRSSSSRGKMVIRYLKDALHLENFPFVVLLVLAALSLLSRLWLLRH